MVDTEAQESCVYISFMAERPICITPEQYLDDIRGQVFDIVLNSRLFKLSLGTDPPFGSAEVGSNPISVSLVANTLSATAMEGQLSI